MFRGLTLETIRLGLKSLYLHKLRSFLTALGIICGVGAVICMLSIGEGASEAEMALIRLLGTQNVIVQSVRPQESSVVGTQRSYVLEYGLTRADLALMRATIPGVNRVIPLREVAYQVVYGSARFQSQVFGAEPAFFEILHIRMARGRTLETLDETSNARVCVIGDEVRTRLFAYQDPIGQTLYVDKPGAGLSPYEVVGVLERTQTAGAPAKGVNERDINSEVFIPLSTADKLYGDLMIRVTSGSYERNKCTFSDFYIQVDSIDNVLPVSEMVRQALAHLHDKADYAVKVPLERLRLAENEKRRRQITLGCIAGISLLVGGIGIMNIMLATVTERTREIGIRRALGAKRRHIVMQFLMESLMLSTVGGLIGVVSGSAGAHLITTWVGWPTVIHNWTILCSFGLAMAVGLFFGIYPAANAARLDPIEALRQA
jgi:putative ABC transport system permease protein